MTMKIKTKVALKDLKGTELKSEGEVLTVGTTIANILLMAKEEGKMKMYILAQKFHDSKEVDVDKADFALIKKAIETTQSYTALVSGQLLTILDAIKEEKE